MSDDDDGLSQAPPLAELARGFRKRTWVTARLMAKVGYRMARGNKTAKQLADAVDEDDAVDAARELLDQLDGLKGLTMKVGQMMSYVDSSLPPKARRVLSRLQSSSRPMEAARIAEVIERELGAPPDRVFDRFDPVPFAAASIGQVHRAELGGRAYAVKVQYPGIEELLRTDVATVGKLARLATMLSPVDGKGLVDELAARVQGECDYIAEADNQELFARLFADHRDLSVPAVRRDRSTRRVLTTALAERAGFQDFVDRADQAARDRAGAAIYRACMVATLRHCTYNADPHPGNYLFDDDGAVTLLDFGCVKRFDPAFIASWRRLARSILDDDRAAFRSTWADLGFVGRKRGFDFDHQFEAMRFLYRPALSKEPYRFEHDYVAAVHDKLIFQNKNKFKLAMPPDWLFVNRLQFGMFSVLAHLGSSVIWGAALREAIEAPIEPPEAFDVSQPMRRPA
jgi:predicted unusual protein kinase regulating ubiquinone biosynthesis (AarF/ABC1/UbiB family)